MLDWINQNSQVVNVLINAGMLLVWLFYAQLLLSSLKRQRRPQLLIAQTKGWDIDSELTLSNMSEQSVFIEGVVGVLETDRETLVRAVTDAAVEDDDDPSRHFRRATSQGPLGSGSEMRLGTFRKFARSMTPGNDAIEGWDVLEVRVIFRYGSEDEPLGVWRRFGLVDGEDGRELQPETMLTQRLSSWRQRKTVQRWLADCLPRELDRGPGRSGGPRPGA